MYTPSSGPSTRGRGLREQLQAAIDAHGNPDILRALNGDHTPHSVLTTPAEQPKMADFTQSPGLMQQIIDKLRGVSSGGPGPQLDGWRLANQERQANGEPSISYAEWIKSQPAVGSH
jgi:hypothetical protein